jgi:hypothetical protein
MKKDLKKVTDREERVVLFIQKTGGFDMWLLWVVSITQALVFLFIVGPLLVYITGLPYWKVYLGLATLVVSVHEKVAEELKRRRGG